MFYITISQDETGQIVSEYDKDAVSLISRHRTIREALGAIEDLIYGDETWERGKNMSNYCYIDWCEFHSTCHCDRSDKEVDFCSFAVPLYGQRPCNYYDGGHCTSPEAIFAAVAEEKGIERWIVLCG